MWCHCRAVYLPMSYVYGKRFVGRITPLVLELRNELYGDPYSLIDWNKARNQCAKVCLFVCLRSYLITWLALETMI
jgi:cycloartenol synthase